MGFGAAEFGSWGLEFCARVETRILAVGAWFVRVLLGICFDVTKRVIEWCRVLIWMRCGEPGGRLGQS
jgi:hypothetical protein